MKKNGWFNDYLIEEALRWFKVDRTSAIKILVTAGWKELRLKKALELYRSGKASVDKAAKIAGLTVSEMMEELAVRGIKSEETIEEYRQGVKILLSQV